MWPFGDHATPDQPRRGPNMDDHLLARRIVALQGILDEDKATRIVAKLLFLQFQSPREPITLLIDSPGGSVVAGMCVIDAIKSLSPPVHTRCKGGADGMAAIVLACGRPGERVVTRGSSISLTPITAGVPFAANAAIKRVQHQTADVLAEAVGLDAETVGADMLAGRCFGPTEAVEYGLADRVVE